MKKNRIDQQGLQSDRKSKQQDAGIDGENPHKKTWYALPIKPEKNIPVKADLDNRRSIKNRPHLH